MRRPTSGRGAFQIPPAAFGQLPLAEQHPAEAVDVARFLQFHGPRLLAFQLVHGDGIANQSFGLVEVLACVGEMETQVVTCPGVVRVGFDDGPEFSFRLGCFLRSRICPGERVANIDAVGRRVEFVEELLAQRDGVVPFSENSEDRDLLNANREAVADRGLLDGLIDSGYCRLLLTEMGECFREVKVEVVRGENAIVRVLKSPGGRPT